MVYDHLYLSTVWSPTVRLNCVSKNNKANSHKSRALETVFHKIHKKLRNVTQKCTEVAEMYRSLKNVQKSQKCTEVAEMYRSRRNVL